MTTTRNRRRNFGSMRKRGVDLWELRYSTHGHRHSKSFRGTKRQAEEELARIYLKAGENSDMTVAEFWERVFKPECERRISAGDMSPTTFNGYTRTYNAHILPRFGNTVMCDVVAHDVQEWLSEMTKGSAIHSRSVFRIILRRAEDLEYISKHPLNKRYIIPSEVSSRARSRDIFSYDEMLEIAGEIKGEIFEAAYLLAAGGGGILSEVLGSKVKDCEILNIDGKIIFVSPVNGTVHYLNGEVILKDSAKNVYREAPIIVSEPYSLRLVELLAIAKTRGDVYLTDDGFGNPCEPTSIQRQYKKWFTTSSHRYVPFANLRNSYSTALHNQGLDPATISKLMRHSNLQTDYIHYNRQSVDDLAHILARS